MNTQQRIFFILFTVCMAGLPLVAQTDCMEKEEELGEPLRSDITRVIDPETYEETVRTVDIYREGEVTDVIRTDTVYTFDPETQDPVLEITHAYKIDPMEADKVVEKQNKKIYYTQKDDCLRIFKIVETYQSEPKKKD